MDVDLGGDFDFSNVLSAVVSVAGIAVSVGVQAAKFAYILNEAAQKANKTVISQFKPKLNNEIKKIKQTQSLSEKVEKVNLEKLVNTNDKQEYSNLYKTLVKQKALNSANKDIIAKLEYAVENQDYETAISELQNYQVNNSSVKPAVSSTNEQKTFVNQLKKSFNNYKAKVVKDFKYGSPLIRTGLHNYPKAEKFILENGMSGYDKIWKSIPDGKEFFKASLYNFEKSGGYIKKNGFLLNSTSELPTKLQFFVSNKLYKEISVYDSKGLVFKHDSSISKSIVKSDMFKSFVRENKVGLLMGETINSSVNFDDWGNTHIALGHTDIVDVFVDSKGTLFAKVIDVYDFNKEDPFWGNEWGHNLQELGMLTNFFTVSVIMLPYNEWIKI